MTIIQDLLQKMIFAHVPLGKGVYPALLYLYTSEYTQRQLGDIFSVTLPTIRKKKAEIIAFCNQNKIAVPIMEKDYFASQNKAPKDTSFVSEFLKLETLSDELVNHITSECALKITEGGIITRSELAAYLYYLCKKQGFLQIREKIAIFFRFTPETISAKISICPIS